MTKIEKKQTDFNLNIEEMGQAGLHFGHRTSRINPKINPYLYGVRNNVHIFDLEKTIESFKEALAFIQNIIKEGKIMVVVGTKIQIKVLAEEMAKECGLPYVTERWLGGTFTNFETIKKRIEYFKSLERKKAEGELEKYTKKERANFDKELKDLEIKFRGLRSLEKIADAVLVLDMRKDALTVKEARAKGVKVIGVADTNTDPTLADYPIPANDDAISSVKYILGKIKETVLGAKPEIKPEPQK
ncbi:MAG: 30S ribosomal protein S2 [bacterium]|nr:30S ribosomal protein S2 [bacterium]